MCDLKALNCFHSVASRQKLGTISDWDTDSLGSVELAPYMRSNTTTCIVKPVFKGGQLCSSDTGLKTDVSCAAIRPPDKNA